MTGGAFKVFFEGLPQAGGRCCLPEIVVDEIIACYKRRVLELAGNLSKAIEGWRRVSLSTIDNPVSEADVARIGNEYIDYLHRKLKEEAVTIVPYPKISHKEVVQWAIDKRKPFHESGSGYRDALIWETIVSLKKTKPTPTVLITANSRDFGNSPHFHVDLTARIQPNVKMELFNSLQEFNAARIFPQLEHLKKMMSELESDTFSGFSLNIWAKDGIPDMLNDFEAGFDFVGLENGHGRTWISELVDHGRFRIDDVRLLPSGDFIISASVDVKVDVTTDANDEDSERYDDIREFFGVHLVGHVSADIAAEANIAFTLTVNRDKFTVHSAELDEFDGAVSYEINPHPRKQA